MIVTYPFRNHKTFAFNIFFNIFRDILHLKFPNVHPEHGTFYIVSNISIKFVEILIVTFVKIYLTATTGVRV